MINKIKMILKMHKFKYKKKKAHLILNNFFKFLGLILNKKDKFKVELVIL